MWLTIEIIILIISVLLYFFPSTRLIGIVFIILFVLIEIGSLVHSQLEKKDDIKFRKGITEQTKANAEQTKANAEQIRIVREQVDKNYSEFKELKGERGATLSNVENNKEKLSKYGGALYIKLIINGIDTGGSYLLDYGDVKDLQRNRIYLYANDDKTISMVLYDAEGKEYRITSNVSIAMNKSYEISCIWNKNYGDIVLFIDNMERGKASIKPLNIEPVTGELTVGSDLNGTGQGALLIQQVAIFAFNPN